MDFDISTEDLSTENDISSPDQLTKLVNSVSFTMFHIFKYKHTH